MNGDWAQFVLGALGGGGILGALVALVKLPGERDGIAVTGAQGAVAAMQTALDAKRAEAAEQTARGDWWKAVALAAEQACLAAGAAPPPRPPRPDHAGSD